MKKRTSVQSTKTRGLLRSLTIPRLLALETMSQDIVRRGKPARPVQSHVVSGRLAGRLPILGLRSQREQVRGRLQKVSQYSVLALKDALREIPGTRSICEKRSVRREQLFKMGVAGKGKRRSPGQGGHYKRKQESNYSCRTYRR